MEQGVRTPRWLVVDADLATGEATVAFLRSRGLQGGLVHSARRAFELLRSPVPVDGIVCDIRLPRMDGFEACHEILHGPNRRDLPIFLVTTRFDRGERELAEQVGARGLLVKPLDDRVLPFLASALVTAPPPSLVVGTLDPNRPTLAPAPSPSPRARVDSLTFARCTTCARTYALPDEIHEERQLVLCPSCIGLTA